MIDPSLSFKGHIIAQTKAAHQRRESVHEAGSLWPSSELAPIKSEHSSQGHLASMFIGLCKDECSRVHMNISLHPCFFFFHVTLKQILWVYWGRSGGGTHFFSFWMGCEWCCSQRVGAEEKGLQSNPITLSGPDSKCRGSVSNRAHFKSQNTHFASLNVTWAQLQPCD